MLSSPTPTSLLQERKPRSKWVKGLSSGHRASEQADRHITNTVTTSWNNSEAAGKQLSDGCHTSGTTHSGLQTHLHAANKACIVPLLRACVRRGMILGLSRVTSMCWVPIDEQVGLGCF